MFIDQLCHLKHTDLFFAVKDFFKLVIGVDHALVLAILQSIFVDIIPDLIRDFLAWNRLGANYGSQRSIRLQRLLQRGTAVTLSRSLLSRGFLRWGFLSWGLLNWSLLNWSLLSWGLLRWGLLR